MNQPSLFEFRMGERSPDTLVVAEANRDAARLLTGWRAWPGGALGLVGPKGAGKTHLALAWAVEAGARQLAASAAPDEGAALFEEAGAVLLVGASPPSQWPVSIPDLRSRLAALPIARLGEPDEALLGVVLTRFCRENFIYLSDDAAKFLARRLPRTFAAARDLVGIIEADLAKASRPVTLPMAKRALEKAQSHWAVDTIDGDEHA
jgi:chromosomal replication initiation ATPase DnaA